MILRFAGFIGGAPAHLRGPGGKIEKDAHLVVATVMRLARPSDEDASAIIGDRTFRAMHFLEREREEFSPMAARMAASTPG